MTDTLEVFIDDNSEVDYLLSIDDRLSMTVPQAARLISNNALPDRHQCAQRNAQTSA